MFRKILLLTTVFVVTLMAACANAATPTEMPTGELCAVLGNVKNDLTFEGIDCHGDSQQGTPLQTANLYLNSVYTIINEVVYTCTKNMVVWQCFPHPEFTVENGKYIHSTVTPMPAATVQFQDPLFNAPTAQQLEQYSLVPTATLVFSIGQFQPNALTQSVPTLQITPPSDSSPYCFVGREGSIRIYGEMSGGQKIEIVYIGQFEEIEPLLFGNDKTVSSIQQPINSQNGEVLVGSIAPINKIDLPDGTSTNWQIVAVYCFANGLPRQGQALEYIQGGIYRILANSTYAYYQTIGYEVRYIDNETGRSKDPNPPPSDEMVTWPIPGVTIMP